MISKYSNELKLGIVQYYLSGKVSFKNVTGKGAKTEELDVGILSEISDNPALYFF